MELLDSPVNPSRAKDGSQKDQLWETPRTVPVRTGMCSSSLGIAHPQKPQGLACSASATREGLEIPKGNISPGKPSRICWIIQVLRENHPGSAGIPSSFWWKVIQVLLENHPGSPGPSRFCWKIIQVLLDHPGSAGAAPGAGSGAVRAGW